MCKIGFSQNTNHNATFYRICKLNLPNWNGLEPIETDKTIIIIIIMLNI